MKPARVKTKLLKQRLGAFFLSLSFTLFNCLFYALPAYAQHPEPVSFVAIPFSDISKVTLPKKLGTIQEVFRGSSSKSVILIQDAHTLYEAQKSIQGMIDYFQKQYGLTSIALEGGSGKVDPLLFRTYPNPEELKRIFEDYLKKGELSGALIAAILNDKEADYYGIEDQSLYEKGILAFLEAERAKPKLLRHLENLQKRLDLQKKRIYSKELLKLDQAVRDFEDRKTDLMTFLQKLPIEPSPILFPHLNALRREMAGRSEADQETANLLREMQPPVFFKELETYIQQMKSSLLADPKAQRLDKLNTDLTFLRRLTHLELTREDWDKFQIKLAKVRGSSLRGQVVILTCPLSLVESHLRFYEIAVKRDKALFENVMKVIGPALFSTTLLIAGGFHTQGLIQAFKQEGISYVLISPRITQIPEEDRYLQMMRGDVSWKRYFRLRNGKINLYDAFAQATVDKLLSAQGYKSTGAQEAKTWRDEIIRNLAGRNKIGKAGEYTRFLDETRQDSKGRKRIEDFLLGLKGLKVKNQLTEEDLFQLFQKTNSMPIVSIASGIPSFETLPNLVGLHASVFARSEVRDEIPLPKDLRSDVDEIVKAMLEENFQGVIEKVGQFIKTKEDQIHQLTDLRMKRSLLDWSETTREIAEQIRDIRSLAAKTDGIEEANSGNGKQVFEEPKQGMIIPFPLVDGEMNQRITLARKSQEHFVGIVPPLYELGDWPYYLIAKDKATIENVIGLFEENKNKTIEDAFRMKLGELLGYTEEEIAKFFGQVRYPKNRITPVEVRHFWEESKLGYLKYLVGKYKDVLGIGGEIQRLMGFRALAAESSFYEVAGELVSTEIIRSLLEKDYDVEVLAFGIFIGFREFDAVIRIKARNLEEKERLRLEEGIYFIEAKHDDLPGLENLIQDTLYHQVMPQMENLEYLTRLGAPVKGVIVAAGGKNATKREVSLKNLKREKISERKIGELPIKHRPRQILPVYTLILPSYDIENAPYPESIPAFVPDAELVKRWSRQPLDILSLLKSRLFGNVWPPLNHAETDALTELQRRQRERFILMKKNREEQKRRALAQAKDEEKRENEVFAWLDLFQKAGVQDPLLEPTLAKYFGEKSKPLFRLRVELQARDPEGAWEWLKEQANGLRKNGASKTIASETIAKSLPAPRQSPSQWLSWERDEDIEKRIESEVSGQRESLGWVVSFAERKEVVSEAGNSLSQTEAAAVLKEYFNQVKNQPVAKRQKYFSRLRNQLQQSIQTAGRQKTWNLLKDREWDQLRGTVAMRSEIRWIKPVVQAVVQGEVPGRVEIGRFGEMIQRVQNWEAIEKGVRHTVDELLSNAAPKLSNQIVSLIRKNPMEFFERLHQARGRFENVPQIDRGLSFAIHAPLISDSPGERRRVIEKTLGKEGYLVLPFETIPASRQKKQKDSIASDIYALGQSAVLTRFRPIGFVEKLDHEALERKINDGLAQKALVTLMADGSLRLPQAKKGKTLAFVIEPQVLAVLKISDLISLLEVIGSAPAELRRFYLEEFGFHPDSRTGVATIGNSVITRLNEMAKMLESVTASA